MLLETAIDVILQLADGIAELHTAGVIHRDIKPANIIVDSAHGPIRPILIDFGIAHVEYEQRLTDGNDPVGNQGYSHDVMMNRMDRVPPWLDIFQLSQLLIWMIQVQPGKRHWDRPLDWRFVRYDDRLPENLAVGVRAITALCSEERISPQNGRELAFLVRERISLVTPSRVKSTVVDLATIHEGIAKGKSIQDIHIANDLRAIEASAISMYAVYSQLRQGLEELAQRLHDGNVPFAKSVDVGRADFIETLVNGNGNVTEVPLYQLDFGNSSSQRFHFRVNCFVVVPSLKDYMNAPVLPESSNIIRLYLQRYANLVRVTFPHITKVVTFERDGTLWLRNEQLTECEKTDVAELLRQIENWITDLPPWEMIQRDR